MPIEGATGGSTLAAIGMGKFSEQKALANVRKGYRSLSEVGK
jgi:hypothetical protein